ncbi:MAG: DUF2341 domain-containing protein, partial [Bacteroidales bacterium]|nr:DUF2341 domain-containing protein [Bacteroidales bacterium]
MTIRKTKLFTVLAILFFLAQGVYGQWLAGYSYREKITIDHTQVVGGPHVNFPFLIHISADNDLRTITNGGFVVNASGDDFRFTDEDAQTLFDFDIEKYDETTGELVVWVKIPSLSSSADQDIYLYFDNPSASSYSNSENTWSEGYLGVWHFHQNLYDATVNNNNGTNYGTTDIVGIAADGRAFDGSSDSLQLPDIDADTGTFSFWFKPNALFNPGSSNSQTLINKFVDNSHHFSFILNGNDNSTYADHGKLYFKNENQGAYPFTRVVSSTNQWSAGTWYYISGSWGNNQNLYVNAVLENSSTNNTVLDLDKAITVGAGFIEQVGQVRYFNGDMDEIRISNEVRSQDWITTEYNNQSNPSSFISVGPIRIFNDEPCDAQKLDVKGSCLLESFANIRATTTTGAPNPSCGWISGDKDVWFYVVVPVSGAVSVEASRNGGMNDGVMAVYSGSCNALIEEACNNDFYGIGDMPKVTVKGQTPGDSLWIRFWGVGGEEGSFTICAYDPIPTIFDVSGSGEYCIGSSGLTVHLNGSETGTNYQLKKDGLDDGPVVAGTGNPLTWTNKTEGVYQVLATKTLSGDSALMNSRAIIIANPLPVVTFGYGYQKTITMDADEVEGNQDLLNFPVLISFTDPDLRSTSNGGHVRNNNGYDIAFTDANYNPIPFQLETYDPATGKYMAWVNVPIVSHNTDTPIHMLYGKAGITTDPSSKDTWSSDYVEVMHLDNNFKDATRIGNYGLNYGTTDAAGKIGQARSFDGVSNMIIVQQDSSLDSTNVEGTFSMWINWVNSANGSYQRILTSSTRGGTPNDGYEWASQPGGNHFFYPKCDDAWLNYNLGPDPFTDGTWQYLAVTLNYATKSVKIYVDGVPMAFTTTNVPTYWTSPANIGNWRWGGEPAYFAGMMDDIRVQAVERSGDWLMTEYHNQNDPSSFYTVSPESTYDPLPEMCLDDPLLVLDQAKPSGGTYSGTGVSGGRFYPRVAGAGVHTITYVYTDVHGCTGTGVDTIIVHDIPTPAISGDSHVCPNAAGVVYSTADVANHSYNWVITGTGASIINGQGTHQITVNWGSSSGALTVTETDNITGCDSTTAPYNVDVSDATPPVITCPGNLTAVCDISEQPPYASYAAFVAAGGSASDNCGLDVSSFTHVGDVDDGLTCPKTITRTYRISDNTGNSSTCVQQIVVDDNIPPTASNPSSVNVQCIGDIPAPDVNVVTDEADNCTAVPTVTYIGDVNNGGAGCPGDPYVVTRTYGVTDDCGNSINVTQTITAIDNISPTFTVPLDTLICRALNCSYNINPSVTGDVTDENDNCSVGLNATFTDDLSGMIDCDTVGVIVRTWTLTDNCGNSTSKTQNIWVEPVPTVNATPMKDTLCHNTQTDILLTSPTISTNGVQFTYT